MVEASPATFATVVVVTVTVMAFFSVSAANRIDGFDSPTKTAVATVSLSLSWMFLFLLGGVILTNGAFSETPVLFASLKLVFVAFVVTSGVFIFDMIDTLIESAKHEDFSWLYFGVGTFVVIVLYYGLFQIGTA